MGGQGAWPVGQRHSGYPACPVDGDGIYRRYRTAGTDRREETSRRAEKGDHAGGHGVIRDPGATPAKSRYTGQTKFAASEEGRTKLKAPQAGFPSQGFDPRDGDTASRSHAAIETEVA